MGLDRPVVTIAVVLVGVDVDVDDDVVGFVESYRSRILLVVYIYFTRRKCLRPGWLRLRPKDVNPG